jgi:hypothetical protein
MEEDQDLPVNSPSYAPSQWPASTASYVDEVTLDLSAGPAHQLTPPEEKSHLLNPQSPKKQDVANLRY